ncbi:helix-turn-helix transcriptional regulator [Citrobacter amalonaticus]|uniref:Helix-turn-helix transcriptional regulator n=1 Tax=Citrobacter amalonaticus TaxID=35703 RepID=A0A2S4RRJ0_CITAM|nr:helix-turn-helix transcriptional regulator [Citrobacter amalonaticus]POT58595.1 helix-turn-helix transcriptional regulator [Citrobacter amalonaticus]POT70333.1 helix-turn-helix transcriptional regulator [Citrobacter amalonaticus]POU61317.1 helix-turn-helix transcriptional regulator [Citrobacter amalonaticus]POV05114.1 helix-turn-helix transcriptional regulator [Citrobacter amalonaticus]
MFLVFTKDSILLQAIHYLINKDNIIHIQRVEDLSAVQESNAKVIIDMLNNNILHTSIAYQLEKIKPAKIIIFSPFRIKRCFGDIPVIFVNRNISLVNFIDLLNCKENYTIAPELSFSHRQHQIITYILQQKSSNLIAEEMKISLKTYYCHKYNIMLLLKLRKMSDLVRHKISCYLQ